MNKRERYQEKVDFLIQWILEFGATTPNLMCSALGVVRTGQNHFLVSIKKSGLFLTVKHPLVSEEIYLLSAEGRKRGAMFSEKAEKYWFTPSKVVISTTVHSFTIQRAITNRWSVDLPFSFKFERFIDHITKQKRPDALVDDDGDVLALEVELTQKSNLRIYLGFRDHLDAMKAGLYQKVLYVFPTEALLRNYKKRFDSDVWPMVIRDPKSGKVRPEIENGEELTATITDSIRSRYKFDIQEGY